MLLGLCQRHGQVADALACTAHLQPRAKMRGGVALALLGLHWGRAADVLACATCSWPSAKMGEGSVVHALLSLVCLACIGVEPLTRQLALG
jgi:hypothetical protein